MSEEIKTGRSIARDLIEENQDMLDLLSELFDDLNSGLKLAVIDKDNETIATISRSCLDTARLIAAIKRDAFMVEAGIVAQESSVKQAMKGILENPSANGFDPSILERLGKAVRGKRIPASSSASPSVVSQKGVIPVAPIGITRVENKKD